MKSSLSDSCFKKQYIKFLRVASFPFGDSLAFGELGRQVLWSTARHAFKRHDGHPCT